MLLMPEVEKYAALMKAAERGDAAADECETQWRKIAHEVTKVTRDAARYRWLTLTSDTNQLMVIDVDTQRLYFGHEADAAVDDAMNRAPNALAQADAACGVSPGAMG